MTLPDSPDARYDVIAAGFTGLVVQVRDWSVAAPVDEWTARDVVWHLVDWFPALMSVGSSIELPRRDPESADPARDWAVLDGAVHAMFAAPGFDEEQFDHPKAGQMPLAVAVDMFYTPDVFMHSWDLATAAGLSIDLDRDYASGLLAGSVRGDAAVVRSLRRARRRCTGCGCHSAAGRVHRPRPALVAVPRELMAWSELGAPDLATSPACCCCVRHA